MRIIKYKRRRNKKTDYKARMNLLKSGLPRLIIRKTNRYLIAQIIISENAQDKTIAHINSKELKKHGWPIKFGNLAAAYLTGFLLGKKYLKNKNTKKIVLDLGIQRSTKGSKIYAVVKGIIDSGVNIPCGKEILPTEERINMGYKNKEIKNIIETIKKEADKK